MTILSISQVYGQLEGVTQIEVGGSPAEMVLVNGDLYVSDPEQGEIIIIDGKTNQVKDAIPAQKGIDVLKYVENVNKIYATVFGTPVVLVIDIDAKKVEKAIDFPVSVITQWSKSDKPYGQREYIDFQTSGVGIDYNSNNKMLYVANFDGHSIEVIDTATNEYVRTINNILSPVHMVIDSETNMMLVLQYHENQISFVDLTNDKVIAEIDTGFAPANIAFDTHHRKAYVTHHASPHIAVIDFDKQTLVKKIKIPSPAHAIGIDDNDEIIYATYMPDSPTTQMALINQVAIIDGLSDKLLESIDIESNPYNILIDTENQKGYATIIKSGVVSTVYLESGEFERIEQEARGTTDMDENPSEETDSMTTQPDGGGCLIATAAYGTELAPQVQFLREIRDNQLMNTESGTAFMSSFNQFYYSFSPVIADLERDNPMFQEAVRVFITPMISTLSIMTIADDDSEVEILGLGISVIILNLGMYVAAPALIGVRTYKFLKSKKK
jgi:YVTN family beta-propeller protein